MPEKLNLKGKKFGELVVLEETDQRKYGGIVWKCRCNCGNIAFVPSHSLVRGNTTSCGHKRIPDDLTNKRFGKLVAKKQVDEHKNAWLCECDCGNKKIVLYKNLVNGNTKSCGCLIGETARERALKGAKTRDEKSIDGVRIGDFNKKKYSNNSSGYTGVAKNGNKWLAQINVKGKRYTLSGFDTPEQAYRKGRLVLEEKYLPDKIKNKP